MGRKRKRNDRNENICFVGDLITHKGEIMIVAEVVEDGYNAGTLVYRKRNKKYYSRESRKAYITAYRIMDNGQILRRSPQCIETEWEHYEPASI